MTINICPFLGTWGEQKYLEKLKLGTLFSTRLLSGKLFLQEIITYKSQLSS